MTSKLISSTYLGLLAGIFRHIQAFTRALAVNDTLPHESGDASPHSPRSPSGPLSPSGTEVGIDRNTLQIPETWKYGPDNGALGSQNYGTMRAGVERVEKLTATSDFAVSSRFPVYV